jgi:hypothetical protein
VESCAFRDAYEDFTAAGAEVVGISRDDAASHASFAAHHKLPFVLLSDTKGTVHELYGIKTRLGFLRDRVTFVVDKGGIVRHVFSSQLDMHGHVKQALPIAASCWPRPARRPAPDLVRSPNGAIGTSFAARASVHRPRGRTSVDSHGWPSVGSTGRQRSVERGAEDIATIGTGAAEDVGADLLPAAGAGILAGAGDRPQPERILGLVAPAGGADPLRAGLARAPEPLPDDRPAREPRGPIGRVKGQLGQHAVGPAQAPCPPEDQRDQLEQVG